MPCRIPLPVIPVRPFAGQRRVPKSRSQRHGPVIAAPPSLRLNLAVARQRKLPVRQDLATWRLRAVAERQRNSRPDPLGAIQLASFPVRGSPAGGLLQNDA
jgi:hypothetical protein